MSLLNNNKKMNRLDRKRINYMIRKISLDKKSSLFLCTLYGLLLKYYYYYFNNNNSINNKFNSYFIYIKNYLFGLFGSLFTFYNKNDAFFLANKNFSMFIGKTYKEKFSVLLFNIVKYNRTLNFSFKKNCNFYFNKFLIGNRLNLIKNNKKEFLFLNYKLGYMLFPSRVKYSIIKNNKNYFNK